MLSRAYALLALLHCTALHFCGSFMLGLCTQGLWGASSSTLLSPVVDSVGHEDPMKPIELPCLHPAHPARASTAATHSRCSWGRKSEGSHQSVGLPEAIPQKCMDVPGPKSVSAEKAMEGLP
eukprot:scaffold60372_cov21-Tisochrysis_lutea.AAC.2